MNVRELDSCHSLEHFAEDVRRAADARRRHRDLTRVRFGVGDEFLQCLRRNDGFNSKTKGPLSMLATGTTVELCLYLRGMSILPAVDAAITPCAKSVAQVPVIGYFDIGTA